MSQVSPLELGRRIVRLLNIRPKDELEIATTRCGALIIRKSEGALVEK